MNGSLDGLTTALQDVAEMYGLRLSSGDHASIVRRLTECDRASIDRAAVSAAFHHQGLRAPPGLAKDLLDRWLAIAPQRTLLDVLLEYRLDAIDALSAEFGGKKKREETLRNNLRMYLKGRHQVEARTAKGRTDLLLPLRRAVIETKVWTARQKYEDGLIELGEYARTLRPTPREAFFVLFSDDDPLPEVVASADEPVVDIRRLGHLDVPVIAVPFQLTAPSQKARVARRRGAIGDQIGDTPSAR